MSQNDWSNPTTGNQSVRNLQRIADALGLPEAVFLRGVGSVADLDDVAELVSIWRVLPNDADRRKVLAYARAIAVRG